MSRAKGILICLWAVLAVTGVISSTAGAANQYKIKGTVFTGTETISAALLPLSFNGKLETKSILTSKLPGGKEAVELVSTGLSAQGGKIFGNNKDSATSITFTGVSVARPVGCKLGNSEGKETTTLVTKPVNSFVEELSGLSWVVFTPLTQPFITITLLGCAGEGEFKIQGQVRALVLTKTEEILKGINFNATTGDATVSLKFGAEPATITGLAGLTLSGSNKGQVWGVS